MMIDAPGDKLRVDRQRQRQQGQCGEPCRRPGHTLGEVGQQGDDGQEDEQGPNEGRPVGCGVVRERREQPDQEHQRQVDEPRPVHGRTERRVIPVLRRVEPRLAVGEVDGSDQAHRVVAGDPGGIAPEKRRKAERDDKAQPDRDDLHPPIARPAHAVPSPQHGKL